MTRAEARRILDALRDGVDVPEADVMRALLATGDALGVRLLAEGAA